MFDMTPARDPKQQGIIAISGLGHLGVIIWENHLVEASWKGIWERHLGEGFGGGIWGRHLGEGSERDI